MKCSVVKRYKESGGTFDILEFGRYKLTRCGDRLCNETCPKYNSPKKEE